MPPSVVRWTQRCVEVAPFPRLVSLILDREVFKGRRSQPFVIVLAFTSTFDDARRVQPSCRVDFELQPKRPARARKNHNLRLKNSRAPIESNDPAVLRA